MKKTLVGFLVLLLLVQIITVIIYEKRFQEMKFEKSMLEKRLASLEPGRPMVIPAPRPVLFTYTPEQMIKSGDIIAFRTLEINYQWRRPLYIPLWHSTSWKSDRFCYLPRLVKNNRQRVFLYNGGGSYWFDLSPAMGFTDDTSPMGIAFKTLDEVAVVALESRIKTVLKKGNQITIVVEPYGVGYHIIALPAETFQNTLCQVVTPEGYHLEVVETATSLLRTSNNQ